MYNIYKNMDVYAFLLLSPVGCAKLKNKNVDDASIIIIVAV